jgi:hypothetical protein
VGLDVSQLILERDFFSRRLDRCARPLRWTSHPDQETQSEQHPTDGQTHDRDDLAISICSRSFLYCSTSLSQPGPYNMLAMAPGSIWPAANFSRSARSGPAVRGRVVPASCPDGPCQAPEPAGSAVPAQLVPATIFVEIFLGAQGILNPAAASGPVLLFFRCRPTLWPDHHEQQSHPENHTLLELITSVFKFCRNRSACSSALAPAN